MIQSIDEEIELILNNKKYKDFDWKAYFRSLNKDLLTKYLKSGKYKQLYFEKKGRPPKSKKKLIKNLAITNAELPIATAIRAENS